MAKLPKKFQIKMVVIAVIMLVLGSLTPWLLINSTILPSSRTTSLFIFAIVLGIIMIVPKQFRVPLVMTAGFFTLGLQIPLWLNTTEFMSLATLVVLLVILVTIQIIQDKTRNIEIVKFGESRKDQVI